MRRSLLLLLVLLFGASLHAANETERRPDDLIRAATTKAYANLNNQVSSLPLANDLTVGKYLQIMEAQEEFALELQRADQLGGPRWIDRNTCQIQIEIPTARIAQSLQRIAGSRPGRSPLTAAQISRATERWPHRMVSATGTSAAAIALREFRPRPGSPWNAVTDAAREQALRDANAAAVRNAMDSVAGIVLTNGQTIGAAFERPEIGRPVQEWLASRPVTRVDFRDDLQVELLLSVDEIEYFDVIRNQIAAASRANLPDNTEQWDRVRRDYAGKLRPAIGRAAAQADHLPRAVTNRLPSATPEWVNEPITIQSSADISGGKLKSAMRAETDARAKLRDRVASLQLEKDRTVADAARQDTRVAEALSRFVKSARIFKTEYRSDNTVVIHLSANPRDFWEDLRR